MAISDYSSLVLESFRGYYLGDQCLGEREKKTQKNNYGSFDLLHNFVKLREVQLRIICTIGKNKIKNIIKSYGLYGSVWISLYPTL